MGARGFSHLYLDRRSSPAEQAVAPLGGKANLSRLLAENAALEQILVRRPPARPAEPPGRAARSPRRRHARGTRRPSPRPPDTRREVVT